jgi:hypothetical protein
MRNGVTLNGPSLYGLRFSISCEFESGSAAFQAHGGNLYPIEVKKSATPLTDWGKTLASHKFSILNLSEGAVICLKPDPMPLPNSKVMSLPISAI